MAYVALYRAYRPQKFSEVVGQQHIIKTLQNAISMNKVAHAYLFCGPRGTGKTTLAKIMAKAMNCVEGPTTEPCCKCEICEGITKGTISDVIEIDAASNNGADDIRALRDTVKYLPAVGKYKVYIIDEVHMLSNAAFNALLKTLEEPPKHVIFILATTEPYKLPNTILSRCQRFDFQSISVSDILKRLKIVASEEKIKITDEAMSQIAQSAEGGMRDALSLFDQCISYSVNEEITLDDVLAVSGNVSYLKIIELLKACSSENETDAVVLLNNIIKEGKEVPRIINDIILFLRDVLLFKNNAILEDKVMFKAPEFKDLAHNLAKGVIYSWLDILNDALNQMRFSTQKRAFLELAILKMNDVKLNDDASLIDRVESLEKTIEMLTSGGFNNIRPQKPEAIAPAIPTKEEIMAHANITPSYDDSEPIVSTIPVPPTPSFVAPIEANSCDELCIKDVECILNNASKPKKEKLINLWQQIQEKYKNEFVVQILTRGKIVAASESSFIVELQDVGFCNRIMSYQNHERIVKIFDEFGVGITDFICIPVAIWNRIISDYKVKYATNPKPVLNEIRIGVKRTIKPEDNPASAKSLEDRVQEYFEEGQLKILED